MILILLMCNALKRIGINELIQAANMRHHIQRIWQALKESTLHLIYPMKCLHCQILLPPHSPVLCSICASLLEPIDPEERCPVCFNPMREDHSLPCQECLHHLSFIDKIGAVFDYHGPAATLVKHLKYANQPDLARGMAAFLIIQFHRLQWPLPDAIIPVPLSFMHWLGRGYNQSALLAKEISQILHLPVWHALKRRNGDYSQAALTLEQRKILDSQRFKLNTSYPLQNKVLLIIDDVVTSGSTLQCCAEVLRSKNPAALYALTFCRTLS